MVFRVHTVGTVFVNVSLLDSVSNTQKQTVILDGLGLFIVIYPSDSVRNAGNEVP